METRKLYYEDSDLSVFCATVTGCAQTTGGYAVTLDATAFYPEGGGQPCDTGTLGNAAVLDVQEQGESVIHLCDRPLPVGKTLEGRIDWSRRLDLMQQHAGEHIVSGLICSRFGYHNVGFHIGSEMVTIDFDGPVSPEALPQIEAAANQAVWQNLPIRCWYPSQQELPNVSYRSKKALPWPVRIVQIPGIDSCACCGVHVKHTGQIGLIKLFSCVKFHQGVRIEMACGNRALEILNSAYEQNRQVSQAFSAKIGETGEAARKMNERLAAAEFRCAGLERTLWDRTAEEYRGKGNVLHMDETLTPLAVRELADRIAERCGGTAAVLSGTNLCVISKTDDLKALSAALRTELTARGSGKPGIFQGTVPAEKDEILAFFKDWCIR